MRPYQIYAVKESINRIMNSNLNGFVFHTTGSGKTLTSYKLATLIQKMATAINNPKYEQAMLPFSSKKCIFIKRLANTSRTSTHSLPFISVSATN